jgi:hypothetical protein
MKDLVIPCNSHSFESLDCSHACAYVQVLFSPWRLHNGICTIVCDPRVVAVDRDYRPSLACKLDEIFCRSTCQQLFRDRPLCNAVGRNEVLISSAITSYVEREFGCHLESCVETKFTSLVRLSRKYT